MRSDIFDSYAKIAADMGLVSDKPLVTGKEKTEEHTEYRNSEYPRLGSDDIKTIEALYNVKPETFLDYERNIIEAAHPKPVVIGPAYDRINALVENENEGSNIRCNIATKPTTAKNTTQGPKLARKELLMSLIRIANDLDNHDEQDLRVLADNCIEDLKKKS